MNSVLSDVSKYLVLKISGKKAINRESAIFLMFISALYVVIYFILFYFCLVAEVCEYTFVICMTSKLFFYFTFKMFRLI